MKMNIFAFYLGESLIYSINNFKNHVQVTLILPRNGKDLFQAVLDSVNLTE